jgi:hypothetical protein
MAKRERSLRWRLRRQQRLGAPCPDGHVAGATLPLHADDLQARDAIVQRRSWHQWQHPDLARFQEEEVDVGLEPGRAAAIAGELFLRKRDHRSPPLFKHFAASQHTGAA